MIEETAALTTSLYRLRKFHACKPRYDHLVAKLGENYGDRTPINLLKILETNGTADCLWALCATAESCDTVASLMAADFAESVLHIFERDYPNDDRPRKAIAATRAYARGQITAAAAAAAADAAGDAAWDADAAIIRKYLRGAS
jgi:hypothetical protein